MLRLAIPILLALTSVAGAQPSLTPPTGPVPAAPAAAPEPDRFAVGMGVVAGASEARNWIYGAWTLEAGVLILQGPVDLRLRALMNILGGTARDSGTGDFRRFGAGVEVRTCRAEGGLCGFADVDLGYQGLTMYEDQSGMLVQADRGLFVGPRFGLDLGGKIRLRLALEIYREITGGEVGSFTTIGGSLALAYQR